MKIEICAIKKLNYIIDEIDGNTTAALLCSSYQIDEQPFARMKSLLSMEFDDIITALSARSFNVQKAKQVKNFIDALEEQIQTLYVCCDSGESRSSALAAAIMRYKGLKDISVWTDWHYHPNTLVYKIQCDAFGLTTSKLKIAYLKWKNKKALTKGINKSKRKVPKK